MKSRNFKNVSAFVFKMLYFVEHMCRNLIQVLSVYVFVTGVITLIIVSLSLPAKYLMLKTAKENVIMTYYCIFLISSGDY